MAATDVTAPSPFAGVRRTTRTIMVPSASSSVLSEWSVSSVRSALDSHERGDFGPSSQLYDALYRDPQIIAHSQTRTGALSAKNGLPFCIEPNMGVDDRVAKAAAKRVEALWWTSCKETEVQALHRDGFMLGAGVGRVVFGPDWEPIIYRLRPHGLSWNEGDRRHYYVDGNGFRHLVTPGENGWLLFQPYGPDSHLQGVIRSIAIPWLGKVFAVRDWLRYSEKHGMPAIAISEPYSAQDDVENAGGDDNLAAFYDRIRTFGEDGLLRLPQGQTKDEPGWSAEWLELKSTSHEGFRALLNELDRQVIAPILGRDPTGAASVGGDGAALQEQVRGEYLTSDAEALSTFLRDQVWVPWASYVYGPSLGQVAPWPRWSTRQPVDLERRAQTLKVAAEAIEKLQLLNIDVSSFIEELRLAKVGS